MYLLRSSNLFSNETFFDAVSGFRNPNEISCRLLSEKEGHSPPESISLDNYICLWQSHMCSFNVCSFAVWVP